MELHADTRGVLADSLPKRKGARADEWNGLEHRRGFRPTVGSNPTPSAIFLYYRLLVGHTSDTLSGCYKSKVSLSKLADAWSWKKHPLP